MHNLQWNDISPQRILYKRRCDQIFSELILTYIKCMVKKIWIFQTRVEVSALLLKKVNAEQEAVTRACFRVAHSIVKREKQFPDGELIAWRFHECSRRKNVFRKADLLKIISLSAYSVDRKINDITENVLSQ